MQSSGLRLRCRDDVPLSPTRQIFRIRALRGFPHKYLTPFDLQLKSSMQGT
jgi:hypothetical protein